MQIIFLFHYYNLPQSEPQMHFSIVKFCPDKEPCNIRVLAAYEIYCFNVRIPTNSSVSLLANLCF